MKKETIAQIYASQDREIEKCEKSNVHKKVQKIKYNRENLLKLFHIYFLVQYKQANWLFIDAVFATRLGKYNCTWLIARKVILVIILVQTGDGFTNRMA